MPPRIEVVLFKFNPLMVLGNIRNTSIQTVAPTPVQKAEFILWDDNYYKEPIFIKPEAATVIDLTLTMLSRYKIL